MSKEEFLIMAVISLIFYKTPLKLSTISLTLGSKFATIKTIQNDKFWFFRLRTKYKLLKFLPKVLDSGTSVQLPKGLFRKWGNGGKLPAKKRLILELIIGVITLVTSIVNPSPTNASTILKSPSIAARFNVLHVNASEMPTSTPTSTVETVAKGTPAEAKVETKTEDVYRSPSEIKSIVSTYFKDIPVMSRIAECESHYQQTYKDGDVYRGKINTSDVGVMQINEKYHLKTAEKLGLDIYTLDGNMAYARYLYNREGSEPWNSSGACWDNSQTARNTDTTKTS